MNAFKYLLESAFVRLGTFLTALLLGYGISNEHVVTIVAAVIALLGVLVDIGSGLAINAYKKWRERQ